MPALATGAGHEPGLYDLLAALPSQLQPHVSRSEDNTFLQNMFGERSLQTLVKIHEQLQFYEERKPVPVLDSAAALAHELSDEMEGKSANREIKELLQLLGRPHVKSLLLVHDTIAQKSYDPELPPLPDDIDDNEDSVKIIRLVKNKEPLGATIRRDDLTGAIVVARIMRGGAADRSGLIHVGDELKEVNGIPVDDKKPEEIIRLLAQSQGAITFKVIPSVKEEEPTKEPKVFMKALFDYDPKDDKAIPCMEAGLAFKRGSILQIMSQDDATWWQAKHEGEANPRAGLIPSKQFQERRFALRRPDATLPLQRTSSRRSYDVAIDFVKEMEEDADYSSGFQLAGFRRSFRLSRRDKKTNKSMYECKKSEIYDTADLPTYEEVTTYRRPSGAKHRLAVLVGPPGVGLNELKRKLLISDPQHFSVTVPHTSRAKRNQESDGVEYHFISKHLFETDIHNNKFIEYGEYKGNYYGTAIDSVRSVLSRNKVCLLDVQPHTIKLLRTAEFKPFVVLVKPPAIERLRETRMNAKIISGKDDKGSAKPFTEEDFQEMVTTAQTLEVQHGHLFEKIIVNDDLSTAFGELRGALKTVETETHWLPVSWTHS
ncbi:MAGUK p55 subfamily member 7 isoform X3 [Gasterosteus aculeatus]|uniref:MAGUK p55 subfamily member 7 isoform X1 n=2 Tax=Gasterosteus aculeatus aculeatus TaxID=481459 RepID=UPI001A9825EA|nr:MAGUK p55 subfamily member 7 isoform X1 [Gasterosteus aculeatus aculeatus]XP_040023292.1 MAGUK p55 subfamily member 7 isoform X1 [Gasterosteus aculeatus aculeatus]XP_040023293.1 MAGUK p55 subfamily member 7 isoform X1 [Gasterosteus aculeatus aculeatus]XP_040023294.1 MAGUK p55 subfamily member 7 isoform X1 [Gasterosteus aculeatus aculeatus]